MDSLPKQTDQTLSLASSEQENAATALAEMANQAWADGFLINPIGWYPSNTPVQPILELTNDKNVRLQETPATPAFRAVRRIGADFSPKPNSELHETDESVAPVSEPLARESSKAAPLNPGASRQPERVNGSAVPVFIAAKTEASRQSDGVSEPAAPDSAATKTEASQQPGGVNEHIAPDSVAAKAEASRQSGGGNEPTAPDSVAAKTEASRQSGGVNEPAERASVLHKRSDGESAPINFETKPIAARDNKQNSGPTEIIPMNNMQLNALMHRTVPVVPESIPPAQSPVPAVPGFVLPANGLAPVVPGFVLPANGLVPVVPKLVLPAHEPVSVVLSTISSQGFIGIGNALQKLPLNTSSDVTVNSQHYGSAPWQHSPTAVQVNIAEFFSQPFAKAVNDRKSILSEALIKIEPVSPNSQNLSQDLAQVLLAPVKITSEPHNISTHILQSQNPDHDLRLNQKLDNLQLWNYQVCPSPAPHRDSDQELQVKTAIPLPSAKLEMSSLNSRQDDSSRPAHKLESTVENAIRDLGCLLADLKLTKLSECPGDNTRQAITKLSDFVAASANHVPETANHVLEQELSSLPSLVGQLTDFSINWRNCSPEQANSAVASNNPAILLARQQILAEAVSLRDTISNYRSLEPVSLGDLPGRNGPKFELNGLRGLQDPALSIQVGRSLDSQAKSDPLLLGRGLDGKSDPTASGAKTAESLDGIKIGAIVPADIILPGDKNYIGERKDLVDKKDDADKDKDNKIDKDLITLITAASKIKDNKPEDKDEDIIKKEKKEENESRRKYIVRQGDTLESIAERIIGDRRFSLLLEIVNRGYIRYQWEGAVRKAVLRVAQVLWLPSANEVKVHQSLFFTRKNKQNSGQHDSNRGAAVLSPIDDSATEEIVSQELPSLELLDITASTKQINVHSAATTMAESPLSAFLSALRHAGGRDKIKLDFATSATGKDQGPTIAGVRASYTPEQSWFEIQDLLNSMRISVKADRFPEEHCSAIAAETLGLSVLAEADDKQIFKQLDSSNRIVLNMVESESALYLRQEKQVAGEWKTIACYAFRDGRSVRYLNKSNGSRRAFCMNLPESVVREMAVKDLRKNWKDYARNYEMLDLKTSG